MSDPMILVIDSLGYISVNAVTPSAPAPIDDRLTSTPSIAPVATVALVKLPLVNAVI